MPKYRLPRNVGVHRIAGIGLFRALLYQCRNVPLDRVDRLSLANVVRHRFKTLAHEQSRWILKNAWEAGYMGLRLLDESIRGSISSTDKIRGLLVRAPSRLLLFPKKNATHRLIKRLPRRQDPEDSILARPRPVVPGKRRIPVLTFGNKIPFLRIKKPQPHTLGALLRKRERVQLSRTHRLDVFEQMSNTGAYEDHWDELLSQQGIEHGELSPKDFAPECSWKDPYIEATKIVTDAQELWLRKRKAHGLKLMQIVEEEKELAAEEAAQRRHNLEHNHTGH